MKKTVYLVIVLLFFAGLLFAGGQKAGEAEAAAITEFGWRNYEGTTIRVLANRHPWTNAVEPLISEFTELTGIKVNLEVYPEDQFRSKRAVELISGVAEIDVTMLMPMQGGPRWISEKWAVPIDKFLDNPLVTSPDYDRGDFLGAGLDSEMSTTYEPKGEAYLLGIPIGVENQALMYRKDVFEKYNLSVPKTVEEMYETAKFVNENVPDMVGIVMRGKRAAATSQWSSMLYTYGGSIPQGPKGDSIPYIGTWGLSIPYLSKNHEAAWYFIQWATSKDMVKRLMLEHMILGGRKSAWQDPQLEKYLPKDLIESSVASLEVAKPFNPPVIQISEVRDIVGSVIDTKVLGRQSFDCHDGAGRCFHGRHDYFSHWIHPVYYVFSLEWRRSKSTSVHWVGQFYKPYQGSAVLKCFICNNLHNQCWFSASDDFGNRHRSVAE